MQLAGGNITNSGSSINAQNGLSLDGTGYIDNLNAGLISAGGSLDLSAIGDISNISSVISGKTVQLESVVATSAISPGVSNGMRAVTADMVVCISAVRTPVRLRPLKALIHFHWMQGKTLILPGQRSRPVEPLECLRVMISTLPQT